MICISRRSVVIKPESVYLLIFLIAFIFAGRFLTKIIKSQLIADYLTPIVYLALFVASILMFRSEIINSIRCFDAKKLRLLVIIGYITFYAEVFAAIIVSILGVENINQNLIDADINSDNSCLFFLTVFVIVIIGPIVEEIAYRFCIASIFPSHTIIAGIISVLIFSFMHVWDSVIFDGDFSQLIVMLPYAALGTGLYVLYSKTGNILYPLILHSAINLIGLTGRLR